MRTMLPQRTIANCPDGNTLRGCVARELRLGRRVFCEQRSLQRASLERTLEGTNIAAAAEAAIYDEVTVQ
jgi:hypothetical protein